MSQIERRFCWRCLFFALAPLAVLMTMGWLAVDHIESDRAAMALEADALSEQLTDMEIANSGLRAELGAMREELRAARGAAVASGEGGVEDLLIRLRALPAAQRSALLAETEGAVDPDVMAARVVAMAPPMRARFFDTLPGLESFSGWFEDMEPEGRRAWLRQLPAGDVLVEGGSDGADALSERMDMLRRQADAAETARDAAALERDALRDARDDLQNQRDALTAELRAANAPTARATTERLNGMERAEQAAFFGALARNAAFTDWFERAAIEEREAFAAMAPAAMKRAFEGVTLDNGQRIGGAEIRRRLAAADAARDASAERDALAAQLRAANAPTARALSERLDGMERAEQAAFFGALARNAAFAGWFERAAIEEREAFAAVAPDAMKLAFEGVSLPGEGRINGAETRRRLARAAALDPTDEPARLRAALEAARARALELERALADARAELAAGAQQ